MKTITIALETENGKRVTRTLRAHWNKEVENLSHVFKQYDSIDGFDEVKNIIAECISNELTTEFIRRMIDELDPNA